MSELRFENRIKAEPHTCEFRHFNHVAATFNHFVKSWPLGVLRPCPVQGPRVNNQLIIS